MNTSFRVVNVASMAGKYALDNAKPTVRDRMLAVKGFADLKKLLDEFIA